MESPPTVAVVLEWLSRQFLKTDYEKHKDVPEEAHCLSCTEVGLQECSSAVDLEAAVKRLTWLKELYLADITALRFEKRHASEAQAAILQKSIDQHWAVFKEICRHHSALLRAYDFGNDMDFDATFWRERSKLLLQLPESMQPEAIAADLQVPKTSTPGLRKREHLQRAEPP